MHSEVCFLDCVDAVVAPCLNGFDEFVPDFEGCFGQSILDLCSLHSEHGGFNGVVGEVQNFFGCGVVDFDLLSNLLKCHFGTSGILLVRKQAIDKRIPVYIEQVFELFVLSQDLEGFNDVFVKHSSDLLGCVGHPRELGVDLEVWSTWLLQARHQVTLKVVYSICAFNDHI